MGWYDNQMGQAITGLRGKVQPLIDREHGIYDPYINRGKDAYNQLSGQYNAMNSDPAAYLQNIMKDYKPSQGFQFQQDRATQSAANDAAAGGRVGSTGDIQNQANITNTLMGQDMQKWLQNAMGAQNAGMQGQLGFYDSGYDASKGLNSDLANLFGSASQQAYQHSLNQQQQQNDMMRGMFSIGGAALGSYFGPAGTAAGSAAGNYVGNQVSS